MDLQQQSSSNGAFSSSNIVAEKVIRQGVYQEYEVDIGDQEVDDARSTFKSAKETKTKKGMYAVSLYLLNLRSGLQFFVS